MNKRKLIEKLNKMIEEVAKDEWEARGDILQDEYGFESVEEFIDETIGLDIYTDEYESVSWAAGYIYALQRVISLLEK